MVQWFLLFFLYFSKLVILIRYNIDMNSVVIKWGNHLSAMQEIVALHLKFALNVINF